MRLVLSVLFLAVLCVPLIWAQEKQDSQQDMLERIRKQEQEIQELKKRLGEQENALQELKQKVTQQAEQSKKDSALTTPTTKPKGFFDLFYTGDDSQQQQQRLNAMNPTITVFGDMIGRIDNKKAYTAVTPEEPGAVLQRMDNRFVLRSGEIDIRAPVDPYATAVGIFSIEADDPKTLSPDIEELYVIIKRLPILEEAPLGMKLKIGSFRPMFGVDNTLHSHDLPWATRPLPVVNFLRLTPMGSAGKDGFTGTGIDTEFRLFSFNDKESNAYINLDFLSGGHTTLTWNNTSGNPGLLAHLRLDNALRSETATHDVDFGVSAYEENGDVDRVQLYGADFTYKWTPDKHGHSLVGGGEVFYAHRETQDPLTGFITPNNPVGFFTYLQYQLDWHWYAGVRYDYCQDAVDDHLKTQVYAAYVSYYTTEFLRFRLGYEHRISDAFASGLNDNGLNTVFFQLTWVFGSHPPEPYWVSR